MIDFRILNQNAYRFMDWAHHNLAPAPTELVVAYEQDDDRVAVIIPAPEYMALLRHGGLAYCMRVVGVKDDKPVYEGTGELLPSMTEQEAIEFIAWKDVPLPVQHAHMNGNRQRIVICRRAQLPDRTFRNAWRMADAA